MFRGISLCAWRRTTSGTRSFLRRPPRAELTDEQALERSLEEIGTERQQAEEEELTQQLARLPDLGQALRDASPDVQREGSRRTEELFLGWTKCISNTETGMSCSAAGGLLSLARNRLIRSLPRSTVQHRWSVSVGAQGATASVLPSAALLGRRHPETA
jgi:hypothetical protein